jgi:archaellum component FlaC
MPTGRRRVKREAMVSAMQGLAENSAARLSLGRHLVLATMPQGEGQSWQEVAASNRERIAAVEHELSRVRDAMHDIRAETQSVRYLAEKVGGLADDVRALANRVEVVSRRAVEKPTASGLAVVGQYIGLAVALVALIVAINR